MILFDTFSSYYYYLPDFVHYVLVNQFHFIIDVLLTLRNGYMPPVSPGYVIRNKDVNFYIFPHHFRGNSIITTYSDKDSPSEEIAAVINRREV